MSDAADKPTQPQYSVTIWETIAIALAAVSLMAIGSAGLVYKFFSNAANPQRAALIARSLMDYQIPGGAQGAFGSNFGGAKVAIVTSPGFPRDSSLVSPAKLAGLNGVELFIARVPLDVETPVGSVVAPDTYPSKPTDPYDLFASPDFSFSYRSGEDFQATTETIEDRQFCGFIVPVRIQIGELILSDQLPGIPAVKYDAIATFENSKRQVTLTAIGRNAKQTSNTVFNSLKCK
ncbi:hypothetical protein AB3R30_21500 [Leptolyngbyaceae cyanobacterium UHCC 1019]